MIDELKKVAALIDDVIAVDDFPHKIQPDFLREAVRDYPGRGGKRLRPALLLWCCGLLGGNTESAIPAAAAVEIFHNWTLVHDDIIDNDDVRRGEPTTHASLRSYSAEKYHLTKSEADKFGSDFAILAGDLQQAWANHMMLKSVDVGVSAELTINLVKRMQSFVNRELISGEALDVEFPFIGPAALTEAQIDEMLYLKTGVLLRFCAETGAMIALNAVDGTSPEIKAVGEFAAAAGVAFQYRDDWLGIYGDFSEFGKPICSDLAEAKPTLLLVKALELLDSDGRKELLSLLKLDSYSNEIIARARKLITDSGAEAYIVERAAALAAKAEAELEKLPDNQYRKLLKELLTYLIERNK